MVHRHFEDVSNALALHALTVQMNKVDASPTGWLESRPQGTVMPAAWT